MTTQRQYLDPSIEIPKRQTPWLVWLMAGFALMVVAALAYSFASIAFTPMPSQEVPAQGAPPHPADPTPRPAAPEAK